MIWCRDYVKKSRGNRGGVKSPYYSIYERSESLDDYRKIREKERRLNKIAWVTGYTIVLLLTVAFVFSLIYLT